MIRAASFNRSAIFKKPGFKPVYPSIAKQMQARKKPVLVKPAPITQTRKAMPLPLAIGAVGAVGKFIKDGGIKKVATGAKKFFSLFKKKKKVATPPIVSGPLRTASATAKVQPQQLAQSQSTGDWAHGGPMLVPVVLLAVFLLFRKQIKKLFR